jgi:hypothetical protein
MRVAEMFSAHQERGRAHLPNRELMTVKGDPRHLEVGKVGLACSFVSFRTLRKCAGDHD